MKVIAKLFQNGERKLEVVANLAIIFVAVALGAVLIRNFLFIDTRPPVPPVPQVQNRGKSFVGTSLAELPIKWDANQQTLLLALSNTCHFCTESASFYQKLAQNKGQTHMIAVLPQPSEDGRQYLQKLGVSVDEIRQLPLNKVGVTGTPTLLLVDSTGVVKKSWIGKLPADQEVAVLDALQPGLARAY